MLDIIPVCMRDSRRPGRVSRNINWHSSRKNNDDDHWNRDGNRNNINSNKCVLLRRVKHEFELMSWLRRSGRDEVCTYEEATHARDGRHVSACIVGPTMSSGRTVRLYHW